MNIEERATTKDDFALLFDINKRAMKDHVIENFGTWNDDEQIDKFRKTTNFDEHQILLAGREPIGFINLVYSDTEIHINRLCLLPEYHSQGIGTFILRKLISEAAEHRTIRLQVFPKNPAVRLYRRLGFYETSRTATHIHMVYSSEHEVR